jgi:hypothetical protein
MRSNRRDASGQERRLLAVHTDDRSYLASEGKTCGQIKTSAETPAAEWDRQNAGAQ